MAKTKTIKGSAMVANGIGAESALARKLKGIKKPAEQKKIAHAHATRFVKSSLNHGAKKGSLESIMAALEATSKSKPVTPEKLVLSALKINEDTLPKGFADLSFAEMQRQRGRIIEVEKHDPILGTIKVKMPDPKDPINVAGQRATTVYYRCLWAFASDSKSAKVDGLRGRGYVIVQLDDGRVYLAKKPTND